MQHTVSNCLRHDVEVYQLSEATYFRPQASSQSCIYTAEVADRSANTRTASRQGPEGSLSPILTATAGFEAMVGSSEEFYISHQGYAPAQDELGLSTRSRRPGVLEKGEVGGGDPAPSCGAARAALSAHKIETVKSLAQN